MSDEWDGMTLDELAAKMPDSAMAVCELALVQEELREILASSDIVRGALEEYIERVESRIDKLDESGTARRWAVAWREAESKK